MFFSTNFFFPRVPPLVFFPKFFKFFQNLKKLWKLPYFGLCKVFKAFFNFFFFLKIFHIFGHRGGGVRPNVEFSTFFFFFDGFPYSHYFLFLPHCKEDSLNFTFSPLPLRTIASPQQLGDNNIELLGDPCILDSPTLDHVGRTVTNEW